MNGDRVTGVLLAAGRGARFGGDKLLAPLPGAAGDVEPLGLASWRRLQSVIGEGIVVVRPDDPPLHAMYAAAQVRIVVAEHAARGMGASLAAGAAAVAPGTAIVVALADMPWIDPATIHRVVDALRAGASIVAPRYRGRRGHPVGFAALHREALMRLDGDQGARELVAAHPGIVVVVDVEDPGVISDVDTRADLSR